MSDERNKARGSYEQGDEPVDYRVAIYSWILCAPNSHRDIDVLGDHRDIDIYLHSMASAARGASVWGRCVLTPRDLWHVTLLACAVLLVAGVLLYGHYH